MNVHNFFFQKQNNIKLCYIYNVNNCGNASSWFVERVHCPYIYLRCIKTWNNKSSFKYIKPQCPQEHYLIYVVEVRAFIRPILMTLFDTVFSKRCQHDNNHTATFPNHLHKTPSTENAKAKLQCRQGETAKNTFVRQKNFFLYGMTGFRELWFSAEFPLNLIGLNNSTPLVTVMEV